MLVWADGGWDRQRGIGYAAAHLEGAEAATVLPVFEELSSSVGCELRALALAIALTPDDPSVVIQMDCQTVVDLVSGRTRPTVLEFMPYVRWVRRHLGSRRLHWAPREGNLAHVALSDIFDAEDGWSLYEFEVLREQLRAAP